MDEFTNLGSIIKKHKEIMSKFKLFFLSVIFTFMAYNIQAQSMNWVLMPNGTGNGECTSTTDCESGIMCYGLEYTPSLTGVLTSYTTGFFATCTSEGNPIFSNGSCVMVDNSQVIEACQDYGLVLFNSSGNSGSPVNNILTAGVPIILHQVCFTLPSGDYTIISEDIVTDLTTNIDLPDGTSITEFPAYSEFALYRDEVCPAIIVANDDDFSGNPINDISGGMAGNVLINDMLNGVAVTPNDVDVNVIDNGGLTGLDIDANGNMFVPAGTPEGTYYVGYQICESPDFINCDNAMATIVVDENANNTLMPTAVAGVDIEVCEDAQFVELHGQSLNASGVMWNGGEGFFNDPQSAVTIYYFTQGDILAGNVELCLTAFAIDPENGNYTDCLTLTLVPAPDAYAGGDNTICEGQSFSLASAVAYGYTNLEWSTNGDGEFDFIDIENPVYAPGPFDQANGGTELCLTAWPQSGCTETDVDCMALTIMAQPTVEIETSTLGLSCENYDVINGEWFPIVMAVNTTGDLGPVQWTTTGDGYFNDPTDVNAIYYLGLDDIWRGDVELCIEIQDVGSCQFIASDCMMIHVPQQLIYFDHDAWWGISSYLEPDMNSVSDVMDPLVLVPGSQHLVRMFNEQGQYYWPEQNPPINNIGDWASVGYKIKTKNSPACLPIYGDSLTDQIFVVDGTYTFLPVLTNVPVDIDDLFGSHINDILLIFDWPTGDLWTQVYSDFEELLPGRSYLLVNRTDNSYTIEFPDFDPAAPHIFPSSMDNIVMNRSPWNDVKNTSQPHLLMFADEALIDLMPGDIIGAFNGSDECFGMAEYEGVGSLYKLIAMGNDPYSKFIDGFKTGEAMKFKLYRPGVGISMDVTLGFDPEYPNYDGKFATNGVSRVIDLTMDVTSVNNFGNGNHINIFPNPAIESVNITSGMDMLSITILNHIGQKMLFKEVRGKASQINVSYCPTGIYFMRIETKDGNMVTRRIVIE
ncbi:MAG: hypothetical protein B6I19_05305 [Bacteroidetes bacterium 4572_114]|nr:MAG: hypothetical protein B6I19_05305 [Bacteroidetes bacterium 4572_114]